MIQTKVYNEHQLPDKATREQIVSFLFKNLEQYGDKPEDISHAIDYSLKLHDSFGGFVLVSKQDDEIVGAVVVNATGMSGYIPDNILVYIATHKEKRGMGIGKKLMEKAIETAEGDIALHVEPDNPARFLYEKYGFTHKYIEMRYKQTT